MTMEPSEVGWKRQRRRAPVREELEQVALAQPRGALLAGAAQLAGQPLVQPAGSLLETDRTLNITDQLLQLELDPVSIQETDRIPQWRRRERAAVAELLRVESAIG
jgi:hypothetical protein